MLPILSTHLLSQSMIERPCMYYQCAACTRQSSDCCSCNKTLLFLAVMLYMALPVFQNNFWLLSPLLFSWLYMERPKHLHTSDLNLKTASAFSQTLTLGYIQPSPPLMPLSKTCGRDQVHGKMVAHWQMVTAVTVSLHYVCHSCKVNNF